jgi:hypothetical protein
MVGAARLAEVVVELPLGDVEAAILTDRHAQEVVGLIVVA